MFIKHKKFTDVCIEVRHEKRGADGTNTFYGCFWNLGQTDKSFCIDVETKVKIARDEASNWLVCLEGKEDLKQAEWVEYGERV